MMLSGEKCTFNSEKVATSIHCGNVMLSLLTEAVITAIEKYLQTDANMLTHEREDKKNIQIFLHSSKYLCFWSFCLQ